MKIENIVEKLDTSMMLARPLTDWRPVLAEECQVFVFGENYVAKRFDQIHFKFCEKNEVKEILVDNLYALLRYKYFPSSSEETDERINKIVSSFIANLKTTLRKVSFDADSDAEVVKTVPDYCVAFRNGVFNFKTNNWLFKYELIKLDEISNTLYMYDTSYLIQWYLNYDFTPLNIDLMSSDLKSLCKQLSKHKSKTGRNYCYELMYNIAHDASNNMSYPRLSHLSEILGYTMLQSFSQHFVLLIGSGQNGKNSLFDGCFTNKVIPRPTSNDLTSIENDRFITGALENKAHNIFLETSPKTYTESKMIKALTGSMYQTIESKGVSKYSGFINCKYIFAGNDQDKIKFSDNTIGFRRRINMFEIWYRWDSSKRFLKAGDYFDCTFSDSLVELTSETINFTTYVYFAMYGILSATKSFTQNFKFTQNDWNAKYSDIDVDVKEQIDKITPSSIVKFIKSNSKNHALFKTAMYDHKKSILHNSQTILELGYKSYDDLIKMLEDNEASANYFAEYDIYISVRALQTLIGNLSSPTSFTQSIKKIYAVEKLESLYANKPYVRCSFASGKLRILA